MRLHRCPSCNEFMRVSYKELARKEESAKQVVDTVWVCPQCREQLITTEIWWFNDEEIAEKAER